VQLPDWGWRFEDATQYFAPGALVSGRRSHEDRMAEEAIWAHTVTVATTSSIFD